MTVTCYSGNLVAFLTFPQIEFPVNDLQTLVAKDTKYQWGFLGDSVIETYLGEAGTELYQVVLQKVPSEGSLSRRRPLLGPSPG